MILEDIFGIVDLDGSTGLKDKKTGCEIGTYSLCTILLKHLHLSDGLQLIAEIQKEPCLILLRLKGWLSWWTRISTSIWGMFWRIKAFLRNS
jgi:hypothetical protein